MKRLQYVHIQTVDVSRGMLHFAVTHALLLAAALHVLLLVLPVIRATSPVLLAARL